MPVVDPIVVLIAQYCVALLFLVAVYSKLRAFAAFRATLADYELLPEAFSTVVAVSVIALELAIGISALVASVAPMAMLGAMVLLVIYAAAIGLNLRRGRRDIDCGCSALARRQLLSGWLVLRNVSLVALAWVGAAIPSARVIHAVDFGLAALAVMGAAALYSAINQLMANAPRLDALDSLMDAG